MLIGVVRLPQTVPGLPNQGCHVQFENQARGIEFGMMRRRVAADIPLGGSGITPQRSACRTCHSSRDVRLRIVLRRSDTIIAESFQSDSFSFSRNGNSGRIAAFWPLSMLQGCTGGPHDNATSVNLRFRQLR